MPTVLSIVHGAKQVKADHITHAIHRVSLFREAHSVYEKYELYSGIYYVATASIVLIA